MVVYEVKSKTCNCIGVCSTLYEPKIHIYMDKPCYKHALIINNMIYYDLSHLLGYISKPDIPKPIYKPKYLVKVIYVNTNSNKPIIKLELKHDGEIDIDNFDNKKRIYYSDLEDEQRWIKIDDTTIQFTLSYLQAHHTVEDEWEKVDDY
jgi:hypothetical protein